MRNNQTIVSLTLTLSTTGIWFEYLDIGAFDVAFRTESATVQQNGPYVKRVVGLPFLMARTELCKTLFSKFHNLKPRETIKHMHTDVACQGSLYIYIYPRLSL
jgi:hypothetical protein